MNREKRKNYESELDPCSLLLLEEKSSCNLPLCSTRSVPTPTDDAEEEDPT